MKPIIVLPFIALAHAKWTDGWLPSIRIEDTSATAEAQSASTPHQHSTDNEATKSVTARLLKTPSSSTLVQTDNSRATKTETSGGISVQKTLIVSPGDLSLQEPSLGTYAAPASIKTTDTAMALKTATTAGSYNKGKSYPPICHYDPVLLNYGEKNGDAVLKMVMNFCGRADVNRMMETGDECISNYREDPLGSGYIFKICPVEGCLNSGQNMRDPLGQKGFSCTDIFYDKIWRWCYDTNHNGNGGWWNAGCLTYNLKIG